MILNFEYDKKTRTINRFIKKTFGASCNCALGYDMTFKCYRILFTLQLSKQKKKNAFLEKKILKLKIEKKKR